jgi:hypothetical protein
MFGLLPYCVIGLLAIIFRVNDLDENGKCLIGVERQTSILVIVYDLVINVAILGLSLILGLPYNFILVAHIRIILIPKRSRHTSAEGCSTNIWYSLTNCD